MSVRFSLFYGQSKNVFILALVHKSLKVIIKKTLIVGCQKNASKCPDYLE